MRVINVQILLVQIRDAGVPKEFSYANGMPCFCCKPKFQYQLTDDQKMCEIQATN